MKEQFDDYCMSCFRRRDGELVCAHCGSAEIPDRDESCIPARELLNGRYLIGDVKELDRNYILYKAWDFKEKKLVAIKEFFPTKFVHRGEDGQSVEPDNDNMNDKLKIYARHFIEGAERVRELDECQNLMAVYDCFNCNGTAYIAQENLSGITLDKLIEKGGCRDNIPLAVEIMTKLCSGLSALHKNNLVYRILMPCNVLLTRKKKSGMNIKLINYFAVDDVSPYKEVEIPDLAVQGYTAPELCGSRGRQGSFTDVYAAGAIMYELLTGKKPDDAIARLENDTLAPPDKLNPEVSQQLSDSVMRALCVDDSLRFRKASDFSATLNGNKKIVDFDGEEEKMVRVKKKNTAIALAILAAAIIGVVIWVILS